MRSIRIMPNLTVDDVTQAKDFYVGFLGLDREEFNMGWVARYTSTATGASVQLLTHDATAAQDPVISIHTPDVEAAFAEARERGYEIVRPLTTEPWGVHRFLVRAPDGNVVNIVGHAE